MEQRSYSILNSKLENGSGDTNFCFGQNKTRQVEFLNWTPIQGPSVCMIYRHRDFKKSPQEPTRLLRSQSSTIRKIYGSRFR